MDAEGLAAKIPLYRSNWTVRAGLRARWQIGRIQKQTPLDALFIHTQVAAVLSAGWMKQIPTIVSLDATPKQYDSLGEFYDHTPGHPWLEQQKWRATRNCLQQASRIVTWSKWAKQGLIDGYEVSDEKVVVIPPGVNLNEWMRSAKREQHLGAVKILFVGGNLERKGGLLLLEAFRKLRQAYADSASEHPQEIELHLVTRDEVPAETGLFIYNQMEPNSLALKQLYHDSDIFCLPTYGDCLPMVLSEAGAAGLPLVSTDVGAIAEVVRDGDSGQLVPTGDLDALTNALRVLIDEPDLRLRQGARALEIIQQECNAEANAMRLSDLLKQCADEVK